MSLCLVPLPATASIPEVVLGALADKARAYATTHGRQTRSVLTSRTCERSALGAKLVAYRAFLRPLRRFRCISRTLAER